MSLWGKDGLRLPQGELHSDMYPDIFEDSVLHHLWSRVPAKIEVEDLMRGLDTWNNQSEEEQGY